MPAWAIRIVKGVGFVSLLALLFSWFGVYGSGNDPFPARFVLWFATIGVGSATSLFVIPWVDEGSLSRQHTGVKIALASGIISVPVTGVLIVFAVLAEQIQTLEYALTQYVYVFVVSAVLTAGGWLLVADKTPVPPEDPIRQFMTRLPVKYRAAELYAISAEDHYLRVHTSLGEELILMRFRDALRELVGVEGMQTHRSWWVAKEGVADSLREDGRFVLVLKSGGKAAVSRTYTGSVREAGLI